MTLSEAILPQLALSIYRCYFMYFTGITNSYDSCKLRVCFDTEKDFLASSSIIMRMLCRYMSRWQRWTTHGIHCIETMGVSWHHQLWKRLRESRVFRRLYETNGLPGIHWIRDEWHIHCTLPTYMLLPMSLRHKPRCGIHNWRFIWSLCSCMQSCFIESMHRY